MVAVDVERFLPLEVFRRKVVEFIDYMKSTPRVPGCDEIYYPGEIEAREREKRLREGVFVEEDTWNLVLETARSVGAEIGG